MKYIFLTIIILFSHFGFSQQFLWSTTKTMNPEGKEVSIIPLSDVTQKVLEYYDFYEYYYDLTGFSKTGFKQFLINNPSTAEIIHWDPTLMAHEQIALAFKGNEGRGSIVIVMLIQKVNIDIISFSNDYDSKLAISTISYEEDKFKKCLHLFGTLIIKKLIIA